MNDLFALIWEFFKTGLFAIGGGPATIPFLMDIAKRRPWFTMAELGDMIAIAESTPGPVGINMATYAGYKTLGAFGGVISTLALIFPSIVIILLIARFLDNFQENRFVKAAFRGIKPAVTGLIAMAILNIMKVSLFVETENGLSPRIYSMLLAVVIFCLLQWKKTKKMHPAFWFLIAAVAAVILKL